VYVHTPLITANDCEGAGEMFQVTTLIKEDNLVRKIHQKKDDQKKPTGEIDYKRDFFKKRASLTVSGQLAVENYAHGLTNVYTFGPTFRAEKSHTTRHLSEFWMIEPEMCFITINELFGYIEGYVKFCIDYCLKNIGDDLDYFNMSYKRNMKKNKGKNKNIEGFEDLVLYLKRILESDFKRMSYTEAIEFLQKEVAEKKVKFKEKVFWGMDLASEHERYICEKGIKGPVFLYNYPKEIKAFYMKVNEDKKTVQGTDLLLPFIGEVVGGSIREEDINVLKQSIKDFDLVEEDYAFYLDLRKFGTVPHGGFGLGFERLVMLISGIENIRDAIPFPRYPGSCEC
jgi:asparaginyl-tRNA synthetase